MKLTRRTVLRETVYILKKQFSVELKGVPLNSVDECIEALNLIVLSANKDKLNDRLYSKYSNARAELMLLKRLNEERKNRKWYKKLMFWK